MTSAHAEAAAPPVGTLYRWLVTITGMVAAFTMVLTGTIVNVAVPNVMGAFGVGQDDAQFLATAYIATMTASQLLNAWFVAVFGQRLAFTLVLVLFTAGGLICAVSPTIEMVIVGRIMQGFSAGIIQPLVMVTIFQVFPSDRRGSAMGIYSMGLVLALGLGPVVGGITVDALGWRYIFYVPLPLVATALVLGALFLPPGERARERPAFDWTGYALLCTALYCLMTAIANGQRDGWGSDTIVTQLVIGIVAAVGFVRSQDRAGAALMDLSLFRLPAFAAATLIAFVFGVGNFSITYAMPVFGQLVQGLTPTAAGLVLLPASLVLVAIFPVTGRLSDRVAPMYPIMGGLLLFTAGTLLLARADVNTVFLSLVLYAMVGRIGMGFITPPLMSCALGALPSDRLHYGSGTINFCRQLGGAFGINTFVAILEMRTQFHIDALTATQNAANSSTRELLRLTSDLLAEGGLPASHRMPLALDHLGHMIAAQAETLAFQDGFRMLAVVFLAALVPAWILGRARRAAR
ncbi:MAG: DHA2 family efflux MFS transporter permease subunit [Gammaproteobacteria bacterium]|nr:DHA2 family efflux MFS transporter permease subunit [Gammaproteobacteria bacterium]